MGIGTGGTAQSLRLALAGVALSTVLVSSPVLGQTEVWQAETVEAPVGQDLTLRLGFDLRYSDGLLYRDETSIGVAHVRPYNELEAGYCNIVETSPSGGLQKEEQLRVGYTFRWGGEDMFVLRRLPWHPKITLADRVRLTWRMFPAGCGRADDAQLTNRLSIARPFKISGHPFQVYLSDELFVDLGPGGGPEKNRYQFGVKSALGDSVDADVYFLRQTNARFAEDEGEPVEAFNAVGVSLRIHF